jgi:3-methyladenine DNA glycosylase Tag
MTGQYALRFLGRESFILSQDVVTALIAAGVVDMTPTSKTALATTQAAFTQWKAESGLSLTHLSRVLAMSVG